MALKYNTSSIVVDSDPNLTTGIQGGQKQLTAIHEDGTQIWDFVTANVAGSKWVLRGNSVLEDIELFSVSTGAGNMHSCFLREGGSKMFTLTTSDILYEYNLVRPFDLTTKVLVQSVNIQTTGFIVPTGLDFSEDGKMMYYADDADFYHQKPLTVAWDITTLGAQQSISSGATQTLSIKWKPDGSRFYGRGSANNIAINEYIVGTNWDLTTVTSTIVNSAAVNFTFDDFGFGQGGFTLYTTHRGASTSTQWYTLGTAYDLNSITYVGEIESDILGYGLATSKSGKYFMTCFNTTMRMYRNNLVDGSSSASVSEFAPISLKDESGVEKFKFDSELQFDRSDYNIANKRVIPLLNAPRTVYVDPANGNDTTGILGSSERAFASYGAAFDAIPSADNFLWNIEFLGTSTTFTIDRHFTKNVRWVYYGTGTLDFSSLTGRQTITTDINIYAPNGIVSHSSGTATGFRNDSGTFNIECRRLDIRTVGTSAGSSSFFRCGNFSNFRIQIAVYIAASGYLFYGGMLNVNQYHTNEKGNLFNTMHYVNVRWLSMGGGNSTGWNLDYSFPERITGSGTLVLNGTGTFDVTGIACAAAVTIRMPSGYVLSGNQGEFFLGEISYAVNSQMDIRDFHGRITPATSSSNTNKNIIVRRSSLLLDRHLLSATGASPSVTGNIIIQDSIIEQDNPDKLVNTIIGTFSLSKEGFIRSNATSLGDVVLTDNTLTAY